MEDINERGLYSFKPLQVFYKLSVQTQKGIQNIGFKPLQVFYKPQNFCPYRREGKLFQTLIGILQTTPEPSQSQALNMFQTLIGILQTTFFSVALKRRDVVSNPYRYSTNATTSVFRHARCQFQTLIGILQTTIAEGFFGKRVLFQTLIGILQTFQLQRILNSMRIVSNPYRYSTNSIVFGSI